MSIAAPKLIAAVVGWRRQVGAAGSTALAAVIVIAPLLGSCGGFRVISEVHYRVAFEVEVGGSVKAASAVQGLRYLWGGDANWKPAIIGESKGSAPVLDLGEHGWLVAAIGNQFTTSDGWEDRLTGFADWKYREKPYAQSCGYALHFSGMFENVTGITLETDRDLKRDEGKLKERIAAISKEPHAVEPPRLPAFIWFPRNASFRESIQLCPEDFRRVIGAAITLRSVTVQSVSTSVPIDERIPGPPPRWLAELRRDNANENRGRVSNEAYTRYNQVEGIWW